MNLLFCLSYCVIFLVPCIIATETKNTALYDIEGIVYPPDFIPHSKRQSWLAETKVYVRGGYHIGFLKENGSFTISKLKPGSYIVEVVSSNYVYESVRVDINTKGKFRARKINYLQVTQISPLPYPLKLKAIAPARYFYVREQWRLVDLLFNPMVIMMVLPLACIMLLPHVINDPEAKKEVEQFPSFSKYDLPEVSEVITSLFSGTNDKQISRTSKQKKETNAVRLRNS